MKNEVKRNNWSRFVKQFNSANQFRSTRLSIRYTGNDKTGFVPMGPFMGLSLSKKGRLIDGIQFLAGSWNPDAVVEPVITIKGPSQIKLEKDEDGRDRHLIIHSQDGTEARLELQGEQQFEQERHLVEKVAYSMFEHRGCSHGNDAGDWFEAEQKIRETELQLTR